MKNLKEYELGQQIQVTQRLVRNHDGWHVGSRSWVARDLPKPLNVLFIGERTLSNGQQTNDYDDHGSGGLYYKPEEYFSAALVVADRRRKPFFVPIDGIMKAL